MANEVNVALKLKTEGLNEANKAAEQLSANMAKAAASAGKIGAGTATINKIKNASSAPGSSAKENTEYGVQRSIRGTGASARDFAQQAQTLGGLVHLYATYAANIYAVSAAFTALSSAMDVTNQVRGLDMLGAALGRNLGNTAKQLINIADGAISMKEAMDATTKASTAGLNSDQIAKMAEVAKKASQALGRDMGDAFSRLSRGITKLEPELLDELSLFTKIIPATEAYARSVGKSTTQLTDFEKRQAFANAVLKEGMDKFSSIDMSSNPYSKLQASVINLTQSGLELVNKVLGPLINSLSESPTALAGVLAYIGTKLVSSAIPAITNWRESLKEGAEQAAETAQTFRKSFDDNFQTRLDKIFEIPDLAAKLKKATKDLTDFAKETDPTKLANIDTLKGNSAERLLSGTGIDDKARVSKDLANINAQIKARTAKLAEAEAGTISLSKATSDAIKREIEQRQALIKIVKTHLSLLEAQKDAANKLEEAYNAKEHRANEKLAWNDPETMAERNAARLQRAADKSAAIANAANNSVIVGVRNSMNILNKELNEKGISGFTKFTSLVQGGIAATLTRVTSIVSAFSEVGMVIGAVAAGFGLLSSVLSNNSKEAEATDSAFERLRSTAELTDKVLDSISKKDPLAAFSIESINARSNNLNELVESSRTAFDAIKAQSEKANWWDSMINGIKSIVGKDLISASAKDMAFAFSKAFKVASEGANKDRAKDIVKNILGVDPSDYKSMANAINTSNEEFLSRIPKVIQALQALSTEQGITASKATQLQQAYTSAGKEMDSVVNSFMPQDQFAKLGTQFITLGDSMSKALEDPMRAVHELGTSVSEFSKLRFFPADLSQNLVKNSVFIKNTASNIAELSNALEALNSQEEQNKLARAEIANTYRTYSNSSSEEAAKYAEKDATLNAKDAAIASAKAYYSAILESQKKALGPYLEQYREGVSKTMAAGAAMIQSSIAKGFAEASITISNAIAAGLSGTAGGLEITAGNKDKQIALSEAAIKTTISLIDSQENLRATMEVANLMASKKDILDNKDNKLSQGDIEAKVKKIDDLIEAINAAKNSKIYLGRNGLARNIEDMKSKDEAKAAAAMGATAASQQRLAASSDLAKLEAEREANKIATARELRKLIADNNKQQLSYEIASIANEKALNDLSYQYADYISQATVSSQEGLKIREFDKKQQLEIFDIVEKISEAQKALDRYKALGDTQEAVHAEKALKEYNAKKTDLEAKQYSDRRLFEAQNYAYAIAQTKKHAEYSMEMEAKVFALKQSNISAELNLREEMLTKLSSLGSLSPEDLAKEQTSLDIAKEKLRNAEELRRIEDAFSKESLANQTAIASTPAGEERDALLEKQKLIDATYLSALANEDKLHLARIDGVTVLGKQRAELAKIASITGSLEVLFDNLGTSIGDSVKAIIDMNFAFKGQADLVKGNYEAQLKAKEIIDSSASSTEEKALAEKDLIKLKSDGAELQVRGAKLELDSTAKIAGASKKMFAEKTFAYKLISNVEKAMHIAKLAMMVKEMAMSWASAGTEVEAAAIKAQASGAAAITASGAGGDPYTVIPRMAATAAVVAAVLSSIGGKAPSISKGFTAEDKQKVQNTGQAYDSSGKLVETGAGVFGDPTAKTESIRKSLEAIKATSVEGLSFYDQIVKLLSNIDIGINGVAKSLFGIRGVRTSPDSITTSKLNMSNTMATVLFGAAGGIVNAISPKLSKALFGSKTVTTSVVDSGLALKGTLLDLADASKETASSFQNIVTTTKKSGALFGLIGGSTKTKTSTVFDSLAPEYRKQISDVFSYSVDLLKSLGSSLGRTEQSVIDTLGSIDVSSFTSLKGLTGQDFTDALSGMFSAALDKASTGLFGALIDKYKKIGESALETVSRVVDTDKKVNLALTSMSATNLKSSIAAKAAAGEYTELVSTIVGYKSVWGGFLKAPIIAMSSQTRNLSEVSIEITNALADAAGGIDNFLAQSKNFTTNFLTDAERLAPIQDAVTAKLSELGLSGITSRKAFKELVQSLDLTTESGRTLYQNLMDISDSFAQVYPAVQKSMTAEEYRTSLLKDQIDIEKALGNVYKSTLLQRQEELAQLALYPAEQAAQLIANKKTLYAIQDTMSATSQYVSILKAEGKTKDSTSLQRKLDLLAMDDRLRAGAEYTYALQDESDLVTRLTKARDSERNTLQSTIDAIGGYINTLRSYKNTITLGDSSILTSQQKYMKAKDELDRITAKAMMSPITDEDKKAQSEAINQLSSASDSFLAISKELNASSGQYTNDFNSVMQILDSTSWLLDSQKTDSQKQLDALNNNTAFLDSIATATDTVANLLPQYFDAVQTVMTTLNAYQSSQAASDAIALAVTGALGTQLDTATSVSTAINSLGLVGLLQDIANNTGALADTVATGTSTLVNDSTGNKATIMPVDTGNRVTTTSISSPTDTVTNTFAIMNTQIASMTNEIAKLRADIAEQTKSLLANNTANSEVVANAVIDTGKLSSANTAWNSRLAGGVQLMV